MPHFRGAGRASSHVASAALTALALLIGGSLAPAGCSSKPRTSASPSTSPSPSAGPSTAAVEKTERRTERIGWLTIELENPPAASVMAVAPERLPAHVEDLYRIRPDRRFLYAAAELERLTAGGPRRGTLAIRFDEGRWRLSLDGASLGDLPEFPDFAEAKNLLLSRVPRLEGRAAGTELGPAARAALENGIPAEIFSVLGRLNNAWKPPGDPALAEAGLRGLLWLSLQTYDQLELGDPILGKALALFAIAEAGAPGRHAREESLLAALLGYEDHARKASSGLAADDPVRAFAEWDVAGSKSLARRSPTNLRAQYLYLLRLAESRPREDDWFREFEASAWGAAGGASLRLVLTLDAFSLRTVPPTLMVWEVLEELGGAPPASPSASARGLPWRAVAMQRAMLLDPEKRPEGRLSEIEAAVDREAALFDGPLLDGHVVRGHRHANFYSAVYAAARFDFDHLSSTEDAESLANVLANPPAGTAADLKDWILHRVHLRRSNEGVRDVARDMGRLRHIGVDPLSRISYSVAISTSTGVESFRRSSLPGYYDRLDSRPANLHAGFRTASELLSDPAIMERCGRPAAKRGPRELETDLPWVLRFIGDSDGLRALANDKTWSSRIRSGAIRQLAEMEKSDLTALIEPMRELIREDPSDSAALYAAVEILEKRDRIDEALRLIDTWIAAHAERDLRWAGVAALKSRLLRKRGRYREAWEIARPAAETWKAECLEEAALALLDLGRVDDALAMAKRALERYGSDDERVLVARVLWRQGKDAEAAELLTSPTRRLDSGIWAYGMPEAFLAAFEKADDARAAAAFSGLDVESVPRLNIVWFIEYLTLHGRAELSLKLCERLRERGPARFATVATYHALLKARGASQAREWIKTNAMSAETDVMSKQAFSEHDDDLLWELPDPPDPVKNDLLHMIRAARLLDQPEAPAERRASLIQYFDGRPKKDFVVYGLYFLGRVDRPTLFAQIQDPSYVTSVSWILGFTSVHGGRYDEANSWLQVCMEAGANIPPRYWAADILGKWKGAGCALSELERRKVS